MTTSTSSAIPPVRLGPRYKPYPRYKDSGVEWLGNIPEDWDVKRLRYAARINPPKSEVEDVDLDDEVSFVPMESIGENGSLDLEQAKPFGSVYQGFTYFREGDVIVAKITPCFENGKGAIAEQLRNGIGFGTTELHVFRPRNDLDRRFLFYLTASLAFRQPGEAWMYGAGGQKRVPDEFVLNFKTGFPSEDDQRAIAGFLERETAKIDNLIAQKERLIELLEEKRAALITHAVTRGLNPDAPLRDSGIEWLGQIPKHWKIEPLKRAALFVEGPGIMASDFVLDGVPLLRISCLGNRWVTLAGCDFVSPQLASTKWSHFRVKSGDLLISGSASSGVCSEVDEVAVGAIPYTGIIIVRAIPSKTSRDFLRWFFVSDAFATQADLAKTGTATQHFGPTHLSRMSAVLPDTDEQQAIATYLDGENVRLDRIRDRIAAAIERLAEYRSALITAAVGRSRQHMHRSPRAETQRQVSLSCDMSAQPRAGFFEVERRDAGQCGRRSVRSQRAGER